jgi:hypothetical protein
MLLPFLSRRTTLGDVDPFQRVQGWPDKDKGPLTARLTIAMVNGRAELIGFELWGVDRQWAESQGLTNENGRPRIDPPDRATLPTAITATDLRGPIKAVVRDALTTYRRSAEIILDDFDPADWSRPDEVLTVAKGVVGTLGSETSSKGGRPKKYGEDHYRRVAKIYREADADGLDPTRAVADAFGLDTRKRSTAAKWVAKCRPPTRNLLPRTVRGVAKAQEAEAQ